MSSRFKCIHECSDKGENVNGKDESEVSKGGGEIRVYLTSYMQMKVNAAKSKLIVLN